MSKYVQVPVPEELVMEVLRLISSRTEVRPLADEDTEPIWSEADLRVLRRAQFASTDTACRILTELSACAPERRTSQELLTATGLDAGKLNGLGRFTSYLKKQFGREDWPMEYKDGSYWMSVETAEAWRTILAE